MENIRLANDKKCAPGHILVEEFFTVASYDPVELLLIREPETGPNIRQPVQWVNEAGQIVYAYCADRSLDTTVKTWFLRYDGHATPPLGYRIQIKGQAAKGEPTPLFPVHRKTRYLQFANKKHPDLSVTCCWHYVFLNFPTQNKDEQLTSLAIPMIFKEAPVAGSHLFFQFHAAINNTKLYVGLQTDLQEKKQNRGPGVIFSRWDTQNPDDLQVAAGGFSEIGTHEGHFVGVRQPVAWGAGQWTLRLTARNPTKPDNSTHIWMDLTLEENDTHKAQAPKAIGSLRFPGRTARLTRDLIMTTESYAFGTTRRANVWYLPHFDLLLPMPLLNDKPLAKKPPRITYSEEAPRIVETVMQGDGVRLHRNGLGME
ncbi:MAG: hypothetical protein HQL65_11015 [Magnetococcales bacterium]|nr:hypothetical protein [Magnetococcales bacterium]